MGIDTYINGTLFSIVQGDITELDTDAIVNPANKQLQLGAGVAGAILSKGGASIQVECDQIGHCDLGDAVITNGGKLKAKYVIHAVGPRYGVDPEHEKYLKSAVRKSIELADKKELSSIGIPAVSTGVYGYPIEDAARAIVTSILETLSEGVLLDKVILCLYSEKDYKTFEKALAGLND
ncbi:MAG: O-acetyl-ADP-ribose deacetylase [Denitrovibrio sp.]|nr:MAG: O-acetyl-ADP-ribose deacetylase [Denitrovibrio sp.]